MTTMKSTSICICVTKLVCGVHKGTHSYYALVKFALSVNSHTHAFVRSKPEAMQYILLHPFEANMY